MLRTRGMRVVMMAAAAACASLALSAQNAPNAIVSRITADPAFAAAMAALDRDHDRLVQETIALTEIPAPPFKENARGAAFLKMLREHGLESVEQDPEGNVMGIRRGRSSGPLTAVVAHLDTVFPEGTDVRVKREGTRLIAPGVGDNSRSLAVMLALIRAMNAAPVRTAGDILFVGSVGEEGLGDLRGVKYLLRQGRYKDQIKQFIAIDNSGPGHDIVTGGVGSKRYRVTFNGPGGHSFAAFGLVNPAFAMGAAMQKLAQIRVPDAPKTTFNVGVVGGGTSVNTIPDRVWMEVDMRSESPLELEKVETRFLLVLKEAATEENRARSTAEGAVTVDAKLVGDRPSGQTRGDHPLVRLAVSAATATGLKPQLTFSSTDANVPISMGIPAIRLNSGGTGDRSHTPAEWLDVEKTTSLQGIRVILIVLLGTEAGTGK